MPRQRLLPAAAAAAARGEPGAQARSDALRAKESARMARRRARRDAAAAAAAAGTTMGPAHPLPAPAPAPMTELESAHPEEAEREKAFQVKRENEAEDANAKPARDAAKADEGMKRLESGVAKRKFEGCEESIAEGKEDGPKKQRVK
ncbi:hypothetical protein HDK77DRAFT_427065 [Phyllosticta capitalensis]